MQTNDEARDKTALQIGGSGTPSTTNLTGTSECCDTEGHEQVDTNALNDWRQGSHH